MGQRTTIAVALLTCLTVFSCGSQSAKEKNGDKIDAQILDNKTAETLGGGQPGPIRITGKALIEEMGALEKETSLGPQTLIKKIIIMSQTGLDKGLNHAAMKAGDVVVDPDLGADIEELLAEANEDQTFINLGCDITGRTDLKGLTEKKINTENSNKISTINARTVLLCGNSPLKAALISITAKNVILNKFTHIMVGGLESLFSIRAREINVTETSLISSIGKNGTTILPVGPAVTLAAEKISGPGFLQIISQGSSYEELKSEPKKEGV